ncbi:Uncharacterised protein [uncultured Ruminococcus sp.]|nr:Uncharacterised protein [uncultured Ruminococcus sp.]
MYKELVERLRKMYTFCAWDELKNASDAIETLESELDRLKRERDQAVENLKAYEDIGLDPEEIKEILNAVNGGLAAKNGIWCPKCGDALDIDIVNGVLAIGCFGCGEYTPVSELMKLHLNDAVPVVRCKDCIKWEANESYEFDDDGTKNLWVDCSNSLHHCKDNHYCNYGERKESNE